jgi:Holliday junction resolvase
MINSKRKGNKGEHDFSHWLEENGIKAHRNPMSGGSIWKGDIANDIDITFEIKTVKRINLQEAWKQVRRDAEMASNTPVLAIHFDGMPDGKWLMVMDNDSWLEKIREKKVEIGETTSDKSMKWAVEGLKLAVNKVLKYL